MADKSKKMSMNDILSVINDAMQSTKQSKLSSQSGLHHDEFVSRDMNEIFVSKDLSEIGEGSSDTNGGVSSDNKESVLRDDLNSDNSELNVNGKNLHGHSISGQNPNGNLHSKEHANNTDNTDNVNNPHDHNSFDIKNNSVLGGLKDLKLRSYLHDASHQQFTKMNSSTRNASESNDTNESFNITTQFVKSCIHTWMDQNTDVVYDSLKRITMHDCFELDQIMKKIIHEEVKKILFKILSGVAEED